MKLSSFKVGEYAIDTDGEVVKILDKGARTAKGKLEIIKSVALSRPIGYVRECYFADYGNANQFNEWKRWTPPAKVNGDPKILNKIQEAKKNLEDLEKAYNDSLNPKVEFIPGMAYDISECENIDADVGVFTRVDDDGDNRFIVPNNGDSEYYITSDNSQKAKPLTKPNQKKAAKIIYDLFKEGKFPEN